MTATVAPSFDWRLGERFGRQKQAAEVDLAAARDAEAAANRRVSELREELAAGRVSRGDLVRGQRALAAAQEATEQASAAIRAIEKDALADRLANEARTRAAAREEGKVLALEAAALDREMVELLDGAITALHDLDRRIGDFELRAVSVRALGGNPGRLDRPSYIGRDWGAATSGLERLRTVYGRSQR